MVELVLLLVVGADGFPSVSASAFNLFAFLTTELPGCLLPETVLLNNEYCTLDNLAHLACEIHSCMIMLYNINAAICLVSSVPFATLLSVGKCY